MNKTKVFCLGAHKTGTTTLASCMEMLGFPVCPEAVAYGLCREVIEGNPVHCLALARCFDAFQDSPWNYLGMHVILDFVFPDAKFILTVRDESLWCHSMIRWIALMGSSGSPHYKASLGVDPSIFDMGGLVEAHRSKNDAVISHFVDRPGKLLVVDWNIHGWAELCSFLGENVPAGVPFPHRLRYQPETGEYTNS